jgi:hypothetical protein
MHGSFLVSFIFIAGQCLECWMLPLSISIQFVILFAFPSIWQFLNERQSLFVA